MTREQAEQIARSVLTAVNADTSWPSVNHVANAIMEAVAIEREACAKVIEEHPYWLGQNAKREASDAIRARGER